MVSSSAPDEGVLVRIGCYTGGSRAGQGIVTARVAADGSRIAQVSLTRAADPAYLACSGPLLYAVGETGDGTMSAFRFAGDAVEPVNTVGSDGAEPCHLAVAGGFLVAANYASGSGPGNSRWPGGPPCRRAPGPGTSRSTPPSRSSMSCASWTVPS